MVSLRNLGFIIEMDDFGSGYSSLNMLNQMPLDILKLDMKFIQSETAKPNKQGILRFIMGLARWMKLSVVAEGVETPEQMERLREIGCDYAQGYYMACLLYTSFRILNSMKPGSLRRCRSLPSGRSPCRFPGKRVLLPGNGEIPRAGILPTGFRSKKSLKLRKKCSEPLPKR